MSSCRTQYQKSKERRMCRISGLLVSFSIALVLVFSQYTSAEEMEPAKILNKAMTAQGGRDNLKRTTMLHLRSKGVSIVSGKERKFSAEYWYKSPGQSKMVSKIKIGEDQEIVFLQVSNGKTGWEKTDESLRALSESEFKEWQASDNVTQATRLFPLLDDKSISLTATGETTVDDQEAVGIRVSRKGHRDLNLYFDSKKYLLLKSEIRLTPRDAKESLKETFYSDYKDFDGLKFPMKRTRFLNGKKVMEDEVVEIEFLENIDETLFQKP